MSDILEGLRAAKEAVDRIYANESPEMRYLRKFLESPHPDGVDLWFHPDDTQSAYETRDLLEREFRLTVREMRPHGYLARGRLLFVDVAEVEKNFALPTGGLMPGPQQSNFSDGMIGA